jgi:CRP-like cAMP-binding protein
MAKEEYMKVLQQSQLFADLGDEAVNQLVDLAEIHGIAAGEVIFKEGESGDSVFLLYGGEVEIVGKTPGGDEMQLAVLKDLGDFFGEISMVDHKPRSAAVKALTDVILLEFSGDVLENFFAQSHWAGLFMYRNIARVLAGRLRQSNIRIIT